MMALLDRAEQEGINYLDFYNPDPRMRRLLGEALAGRREKFQLQAHICAVWKNGQYERSRNMDEVKASFEELLQLLQTDYIDVGMVHYVDSLTDWQAVKDGPVMKFAQEMKRQGRIHNLGMSSHNPIVALAAVESGLIDVLMFSVNPCYDLQPASEDVEELWAEKAYASDLLNMSDMYALKAIENVGQYLPRAYADGQDLEAREHMAFANTLSGVVMASCTLRFNVCSWVRKAFFASCCVIVLPPWAIPWWETLAQIALRMPRGSMPMWS